VAAVSPDQAPDDVARNLAATLASVGHQVEIVQPAVVEPMSSVARRSAATTEDFDNEAAETSSVSRAAVTPEPVRTHPGWPELDNSAPTDGRAVTSEAVSAAVEPEADSVPMSIRMRVEAARRNAQFVIIDGEPAVTDAQAYILAGLSDATLLIVDPDATTRVDLEEVVDQVSVTGSFLLGAVIWRPDRRDGRGSTKPGRSAGKRGDSGPTAARSSTLPPRGRDDSASPVTPPTPPRAVDAAR
jgi:Mrp family chromosome partitioning ATPase